MARYFLELSYKGTHYCGWQIQPNQITVQGEINKALTKLNANKKILTTGCGRTDTGVHAVQFYAHFNYKEIANINTFVYKLNNMLPNDIVIHNLFKVNPQIHARYNAISRTYKYKIVTSKNAFSFETTLLFKQNLNVELMNKACELLIKHNNFESFSKVKTVVNNFNCDITYANWSKTKNELEFTITANRFLRNMVRSIVGTMLLVGQNKISLIDFDNIIKSKDRNQAGKSVLANGLFLAEVKYDNIN